MRNYKSFGEMLHEERISQKITLREFCRINDFDPARISKIENGLLNVPKGKKFIKKIAKALDIEIGSEDYKYISDLASIDRGELPKDFFEYIPFLPAFCRKARMSKVKEKDVKELVNIINQSSSAEETKNKINKGDRGKSK
jgi:transcriptional regulator with XRE-family HTH domain